MTLSTRSERITCRVQGNSRNSQGSFQNLRYFVLDQMKMRVAVTTVLAANCTFIYLFTTSIALMTHTALVTAPFTHSLT